MNYTLLNITEFIQDNSTYISNECFTWCKSNIPEGCTTVSPYYYLSMFFIMLGMGLGLTDNKMIKVYSYLSYLIALISFFGVWGGYL